MSNAVIGSLRVILGADSAALDKGLKDAGDSMKAFASRMEVVGAAAGAAIGAAIGVLGVAIKGQIDNADKLGKVAQSIGMPVEELSALKYAADLSDVSLASLSSSMIKLSKNMVAFAADANSEAGNGLRALGVSVVDANGKLKSSTAVLDEVADKFASYKDSAAKTALAVQIFGRAGASMIPLLNESAAGLRQARDEAMSLGVTLDGTTSNAAQGFNDNLRRMSAIKEGLILQITTRLVPALKVLSDNMVEAAKNSNLLSRVSDFIVAGIKTISTEIILASVAFQRFGAEMSALWAIVTGPKDWSSIKEGFAKFQEEGKKTEVAFAGVKETLDKFWNDASAAAVTGGSKIAGALDAPLVQTAEKAKAASKALESFFNSTAKRQATLEAEALTIGKTTAEQEKARIVLEGETIAKSNNTAMTEALRTRLEATAETFGRVAQKTEESRAAFANLQAIGNSVKSSLETAFVDVVTNVTSVRDAVKNLIKDFARLAAQQAFRMILSGGMGGGGGVGGFLGDGLKKIFGFAQGGSFTVGGAGGIDSQLMVARMTPGEMVNVTKKNDVGGIGAGVVNYNSYDFRGADPSMKPWIMQQIALSQRNTLNAVPGVVAKTRHNNPSYLR